MGWRIFGWEEESRIWRVEFWITLVIYIVQYNTERQPIETERKQLQVCNKSLMPLLGHAWRLSTSKEFEKKKQKKTKKGQSIRPLKPSLDFFLSRPALGFNLGLNTNGVFVTALIKARPKPGTHVYWIHLFFCPLPMIHDHIYLSKLSISTTKKMKKKIHIFFSYVQISHFCLKKVLNLLQVLL